MDSYQIFLQANEQWENGNKEKAFELFSEAANLGESSAQHNLGFFYYAGEGVNRDIDKAFYWYKKAWRTGHQTDTCINIAQIYASIGNHRRAVHWWVKAIQGGDGDAALDLAKYYLSKSSDKYRRKAHVLLTSIRTYKNTSELGLEESDEILKTMFN